MVNIALREIDILVTGFSPFEGRSVNSSWLAAKSLLNDHPHTRLSILELPVIWGAPAQSFDRYFNTRMPRIVLAMGEGKEGYFAIETIARNQRKQRPDNSGQLPPTAYISRTGPDQHVTHAPVRQIHEKLAEEFPVELSSDAGNFLCEETLYTLGQYHQANRGPEMSLFVHLPPFGTRLRDGGSICDEAVLARFSARLLAVILETFLETAQPNQMVGS